MATATRFHFFDTKELRSVPVFTRRGGISYVDYPRICPLLALQGYVERTSFPLYILFDPVYSFEHAIISRVPNSATSLHFLVDARTCSQWLFTIMDRAGIDPKYKCGSICMGAASPAIDWRVRIEVVRDTGRWASLQQVLQPSLPQSGGAKYRHALFTQLSFRHAHENVCRRRSTKVGCPPF